MKLFSKLKPLVLFFLTLTYPLSVAWAIGEESDDFFCVDLKKLNKEPFSQSMGMVFHPVSRKWLVWERDGKILLLNPKTGFHSEIASVSKNLDTRGEGGLLAIAFHPNFKKNSYLFITRTVLDEGLRILQLERYRLDKYKLDKGSREVMLKVVLPGLENPGGFIQFDAQNNLLLGIGDGSDDYDSQKQGPNPNTLLASLLRLDVSGDKAVAASNNPFRDDHHGAEEVYAYGFRNPVRFSIDFNTNNLWLGDVGFNYAGEINLVIPKYFYGWSCRDGNFIVDRQQICYSGDNRRLEQTPAFMYPNSDGEQIIGGYVYRGIQHRRWYGNYFFADHGNGKIWMADLNAGRFIENIFKVYQGPVLPTSFAIDDNKEMYLSDFQGRIFKMIGRDCKRRVRVIK